MVRVRLSVEERRVEILRVAIRQIEARGVSNVRIADIASALGVSSSLVLYHFSTKELLVAEAFTHAAQGDLAHLCELLHKPRASATRRLYSAVRWYAPTGQAKGWRLWIEGWAAALREPALRKVTQDLDQQWKAAIAEIVEEGVAAGEFVCDHPADAAWRITAFLDGLAVQATSHRGPLSRATMLEWVDEALVRELGIAPGRLTSGH